MIRKGKWRILSLVALAGMLSAGCGSSSKDFSYQAVSTEAAYDAGAGYVSDDIYNEAPELAVEEGKIYGEPQETQLQEGAQVQDTQRKLIKNVDLQVETETFDDLLATVEEKTQRAGGYIEQSYTYNGSNYYGGGTRNASLTIRIPAENLNGFLSAVSEISNVISRNESVLDVTLQYVDLESHKKVLLAEQSRLLELLEQAETIEDIISLESRLSEVRYQIESMESQLRTMDNQVSYSTVELYIDEVKKLTPVKEQTVWQKMSTGFVNSLYQVGNGILDFGIGLVISLPYLFLWAVIILILALIPMIIIKRKRKKNRIAPQKSEKAENEPHN